MIPATGPSRVLHLIDTGGPGGAETVFLDIVSGLDPAAWASTAVVPERDWLFSELESRSITPVEASGSGPFDVGYLGRLVGLARARRTELVHTHLLGSAVYGSLLARALRIPLVATFHGSADLPPTERFRVAKLAIIRRPSNRFVFVSRALKEWFVANHGLPPARCRVIHNGIRLDRYSPSRDPAFREELGVEPHQVLVTAIGNLREPKRYDVLLNAAALIHQRRPETRFAIVGEGSGDLHGSLVALRDRLGLSDIVTFTGFRGDVEAILRATDIYWITSSFEGFSLSTLEAVAAAVPVVATRSGGPEEIVEDGESGILVDPEAPAQLRDAVLEIIQRGLHPNGARRRRGNVERFSMESMVANYARLYDELLGIDRSPSS